MCARSFPCVPSHQKCARFIVLVGSSVWCTQNIYMSSHKTATLKPNKSKTRLFANFQVARICDIRVVRELMFVSLAEDGHGGVEENKEKQ